MAPTRRAVLGMAAVTVGLAGCTGADQGDGDGGGGGDGSDGNGADGGGTTDGGSSGDGSSGATVAVDSHDELGEILVDGEGMVLYMFDPDEQGSGASTCYDDCEEAWPPLTVDGEPEAGDGVEAELTTFERDDGSTQVAAAGWPLYYFANDQSPGDANGQGVNDIWWVLDPAGEPVRGDDGETETSGGGGSGGGDGGDSDGGGGGGMY